MSKTKKESGSPRMPKVWQALLVLAVLIAALAVGIIIYGVDPHVPMLLGVMSAALMAAYLGYSWEQIEGFMIKGISKAMQSIIILVIIGVLIGVWLDAGITSTLGISAVQYAPWAVFNWLMPIACIIMAFMGITLADRDGVRLIHKRKM